MSDGETLRLTMPVIESLIDRYAAGRLRRREELIDAASALAKGVAAVRDCQMNLAMLITTAQACQTLGEINLQLSRVDDAIDAFDEAIELFERSGGDNEAFGRFLHDYSITLQGLNVPDAPLQLAERSREILGRYGRHYIRDLDTWIAKLRHGSDSVENIESLRLAAAKARRGMPRARAAQQLAVMLSQRADAARYADEIFDGLRYAFDKLSKRGTTDDANAALTPVLNMYWIGATLPDWVGDAAQKLVGKAEREGRIDVVRDGLIVRACWLAQRGHGAEALETALHAVARHDEYMLATETSTFRMLTGYVGQFAREIAVRTALHLNDITLAAELLETARLQVLPDGRDDPTAKPGRSRVNGLRTVSVAGRSRLAPYYAPGVIEDQITLEATIAAVGGDAAIWWSSWLINGCIYWTVRLDGRWTGGVVDVASSTGAGGVLRRALDVSMHNPIATARDVITGEWCRSVAAEEMLSVELGEVLIPDVLRAALLDGDPQLPRSLVVAGNLVNQVPLPLLGMRRNFLDTPIRLVEVAVLRVAPPAVYVDVVVRRASPIATTHPIHVACVDPTGNLTNSRTPPSGAEVILSGAPNAEAPRATLRNLAAALASITAGEPGIFYYSGHTDNTGIGGDDEDSLSLSDGGVLSARTLFGSNGATFAFPARSIISACESGGTAGAGAGEWLGLGAAILWRGSRQVVATNWNIWDTGFTRRFDHEIAERLQSTDDPARALRDAQLAALNQWLASRHSFANFAKKKSLPGQANNLALPLIWGAYCCLGIKE
ncbi:tetratricopeptide (TPR) repeat protein [Allocatelliglobosispora scoriae]|uniref:Tetratricopeptide (TPR) repeat protein n=1 Tax=Allocatelliglobosispora scoriae TaxID=643052 RepID=A0A841BZ68_9ACTN|nr:CHAT domain-containing protein [Allocatelliglobosispora scoriae]MBB5871961.1 tetratricopeptide (TPR) repeat protein [Allocatelliglobosispora scoriae]